MIYRFSFFQLLLCSTIYVVAQSDNLVPNPGFEERTDCILNSGDVEQTPPWFSPTGGTPDVFHECAVVLEDPCPYSEEVFLDPWYFGVPTNTLGCQDARSGMGYGGLFFYNSEISGMDFREYLGIELTETLTQGETYLVRFYVSLAERSMYAVNALQVLFTSHQISESPFYWGPLNYSPQLSHQQGVFITDKENWTELSWEYTADGTERFIYIGNFQTNDEIDTLYVLPDNMSWLFHYESYYYIDDIYVGQDALYGSEMRQIQIDVWPNPLQETLQIKSPTTLRKIEVYSTVGQLVTNADLSSVFEASINLSHLTQGVYIVHITNSKGDVASERILKR